MTVECTGAEFNAFMQDKEVWQDGNWFDDVCCRIDGQQSDLDYAFEGEDILPPDAKVEIGGGEFHISQEPNSTFYDFESRLRLWLKARKVTTLVIEVANDKVAGVKGLLQIDGVKVLR